MRHPPPHLRPGFSLRLSATVQSRGWRRGDHLLYKILRKEFLVVEKYSFLLKMGERSFSSLPGAKRFEKKKILTQSQK